MQNKDITERTSAIAAPFAQALGLYVWDVEFEKEGGAYVLTVYIDGENGVSIDDCEAVSRSIDPILDEQDFIDCQYTLCVSSPGLERKLRTPEHFRKMSGQKIEIHLFSAEHGGKIHVGILKDYSDGNVTIQVGDECFTFTKNNISVCKQYFEI